MTAATDVRHFEPPCCRFVRRSCWRETQLSYYGRVAWFCRIALGTAPNSACRAIKSCNQVVQSTGEADRRLKKIAKSLLPSTPRVAMGALRPKWAGQRILLDAFSPFWRMPPANNDLPQPVRRHCKPLSATSKDDRPNSGDSRRAIKRGYGARFADPFCCFVSCSVAP